MKWSASEFLSIFPLSPEAVKKLNPNRTRATLRPSKARSGRARCRRCSRRSG